MIIFFFSSRRRHTRLQGDWSSDVCSSDLERGLGGAPAGLCPQAGVGIALPILPGGERGEQDAGLVVVEGGGAGGVDRKSTRLNSSHLVISYAVFCLKKKKKTYLMAVSQD